MKTFSERLAEIKNASRNETYITQLKRAGENAIILDPGECVARFENGELVQVTPVPVNAPGVVVVGVDVAKTDDTYSVAQWKKEGDKITIVERGHDPVVIELDTTTEEGKEAEEELEEMFDDDKEKF